MTASNIDSLVEVGARAACRSLWEGQPACDGVCKTCEDGMRAALSAIESAGWKCVPVEPSEGMLKAADETSVYDVSILDYRDDAKLIWSAMLSAVED